MVKREKTRLLGMIVEMSWWEREAFEEWALSKLARAVRFAPWKMRMHHARSGKRDLVPVDLSEAS